jgi:hypothetical protein
VKNKVVKARIHLAFYCGESTMGVESIYQTNLSQNLHLGINTSFSRLDPPKKMIHKDGGESIFKSTFVINPNEQDIVSVV